MTLLDQLYHISDRTENGFTLRLDPGHFIYKAHFPGQPITPGVVIIQIALELLELLMDRPVQLSSIRNVKFLHVIDPDETPDLKYEYHKLSTEEEQVKVQVEVSGGEVVFAKISLLCSLM